MSPCNSRRRARRSGNLRHHAHSEMLLGQPSSAMNAENPTQVHGHPSTRVFRRGRLPIQLRHYVLSCATVGSDPPPPTLPARGMAERQLKPRRALRDERSHLVPFQWIFEVLGLWGERVCCPRGPCTNHRAMLSSTIATAETAPQPPFGNFVNGRELS